MVPPLKMEAGKDYVLSAWMKSDIQGGAKLRMSCLEQGDGHCGFWGKGPGVELVIGGEWKRIRCASGPTTRWS
jgi:hypothetical protein